MLLNEETGYFHQVPGWDLNCAVAGAVLAELSLLSRIDSDPESLFLADPTETGNPRLDSALKEIASESTPRTTAYWIERLAPQAESVIDLTLDHLVQMEILQYHDGEFWTLSPGAWRSDERGESKEGPVRHSIKWRIHNVIFNDDIPDPRDAIVLGIVNACDVLRFMFPLDDEAKERIDLVCNLDVIGRSIAQAVASNLAGPLLRHSALTKKIPTVPLRQFLFNSHLRQGHLPALFADLAREFGPVFQLRPPLSKPMIFLAGREVNEWTNKRGRMYLRAKDYFADFEKIYGASGVMPSLDGADHFRLRRSMSPAYSRTRLADRLPELYRYAREYMAEWSEGDSLPGRSCRRMINAQLSPLSVSVDTQDILTDLVAYKERALAVFIMKALPRFMLNTPGMKRRARKVDVLLERIQSVHTPAQRAGCPRNLADDWLALHANDPQFVPETTLRFQLSAALVASVYLGDALTFALYSLASQPTLYEKVQAEADALFADGDPDADVFRPPAIDVTHRFLMECLRMYPVVPMCIRHVMNHCVVQGYELPVGSRVTIATTATHYMDDLFPDPFSFDIDRYAPPRDEHRSAGYAPYGLGTHRCLGFRQMELQLAVNVLMIAHYFTLELPANYRLRINPVPNLKPTTKLKFRVAERRRELAA